ncbi:hypothetical protein [Azotobacter armeniacus]
MMLYLVVTNGPEVAPVLKRPAILEKAAGQVNFQPTTQPQRTGSAGGAVDRRFRGCWKEVWKKFHRKNQSKESLKDDFSCID